MRRSGRFSLALLCSLLALAASFYFGSLFLLLFNHNYHDGIAAPGGFMISLMVAVLVFRAIWRKLSA